jgi:hypothetical protein
MDDEDGRIFNFLVTNSVKPAFISLDSCALRVLRCNEVSQQTVAPGLKLPRRSLLWQLCPL